MLEIVPECCYYFGLRQKQMQNFSDPKPLGFPPKYTYMCAHTHPHIHIHHVWWGIISLKFTNPMMADPSYEIFYRHKTQD